MDPEKLKEILGIDDEEKLNAVLDAFTEETDGLVKTKDKLREQVKELDKKLKAFKDVDLQEIEAMKKELEELRDAAESGGEGGENGKKISAEERKAIEDWATKKLQEQLDAVNTKLQEITRNYHNELTGREIKEAIGELEELLKKNGTPLSSAGKRYLNDVLPGKAIVVTEDDTTAVVFEDKDGINLSPTEYLQDWARSEAAKDFITGPDNSGGGARGSSAATTKKPEEYTEQERVELYRSDPERFHKIFGGN